MIDASRAVVHVPEAVLHSGQYDLSAEEQSITLKTKNRQPQNIISQPEYNKMLHIPTKGL